jgi:hypothetical protein
MAFTSTDLDAVNAAIASGELTVKHNGREVTYRSMDDLLKARQTIQAELAAAQASARTGGSYRFSFKTARE